MAGCVFAGRFARRNLQAVRHSMAPSDQDVPTAVYKAARQHGRAGGEQRCD